MQGLFYGIYLQVAGSVLIFFFFTRTSLSCSLKIWFNFEFCLKFGFFQTSVSNLSKICHLFQFNKKNLIGIYNYLLQIYYKFQVKFTCDLKSITISRKFVELIKKITNSVKNVFVWNKLRNQKKYRKLVKNYLWKERIRIWIKMHSKYFTEKILNV